MEPISVINVIDPRPSPPARLDRRAIDRLAIVTRVTRHANGDRCSGLQGRDVRKIVSSRNFAIGVVTF